MTITMNASKAKLLCVTFTIFVKTGYGRQSGQCKLYDEGNIRDLRQYQSVQFNTLRSESK